MEGSTLQETDDQERDDLRIPEPVEPAGSGGILGQLVQARDTAANDQHEEWEVPNNGGLLWCTTHLLPWKRMKQYAEANERAKSPIKELKVAAEMIAEATDEVWLRDPDGNRLAWPGHAADQGLPFGPELLRFLQVQALPPAAKPGDYVRAVLAPQPVAGGEARDAAVTSFFRSMMEWMEESHEGVNRTYAEG